MIQEFIIKDNNPTLILFFGGWGSDPKLLSEAEDLGADLCLCYDYTTLDFDTAPLRGYQNIELYAWSMGVWAASTVLKDLALPITKSTAINGTLTPIDSQQGIAPEIFKGTIAGISPVGMQKFYRRMCAADRALLAHFSTERTEQSLRDELIAIREQVLELPTPQFQWQKVIIGQRDMIFLPQNQQEAWQQTCAEILSTQDAHYLNFNTLLNDR